MSSVMRLRLEEREKEGNPIRVGVIGAGFFGCGAIGQTSRIPGIRISIIADVYKEKALRAYIKFAKLNSKDIVEVKDTDTANHYIEKKNPVITTDSSVLIGSNVDVILESTGVPDIAAKHAYDAINMKKNIVMATVEAECVIGPLLAKMAKEKGVVYSQAYGDQPALIAELYDWAASCGFKVVAAGEGTAARLEWRHLTPNDALKRFGFTQEEATRLKLNSKMYNSFLDTTKCAVEMVAVCNATGLIPDIRGMHFPLGSIKDVPRLLSLKKDGGILDNEGVVDVITRVRSNGKRIRNDIRWGVFVVVSSESRDVKSILKNYEVKRGGRGKNFLFYRPSHWAGLEASMSLIQIPLYHEPTGTPLPRKPSAEVLAAAKRKLKPGETLDGGGGYTLYGVAEKAEVARAEGFLPLGLAEGIRLVKEIPPDGIIRYEDVELNEDSFLLKLRRIQDKNFY